MRFIFFTKTLWKDIPRIRHQTALMLARRGHNVVFFEKNRFIGPCTSTRKDDLEFRRIGELFHHQLRPLPWLSSVNAFWEALQIRHLYERGWKDSVVLNFNYDYWFLRGLFPDNVIITLINDDFIAGAKWYMKKEATRVLSLTLKMSDHVLAVSYPLLSQAAAHAVSASLFLPWARNKYKTPPFTGERTDIIFWGSIYENQNYQAIRFMLQSGVRIHFVGPIHHSREISQILTMPGAVYHGVHPLASLQPILERCCCAILPYDPSSLNGMFNAVTINNRAFELLSYGLPLLYSALPALIEAPAEVIMPCRLNEDYLAGYLSSRKEFYQRQKSIEDFLDGHYEEDRYNVFMECVQAKLDRRNPIIRRSVKN